MIGTAMIRSAMLPLAVLLAAAPAAAAPPEGWIAAGMAPRDYDMGIDRTVLHEGKKSAFLRAKTERPAGFGTLMQMFKADQYRGKRVRLTAFVRADRVAEWAGLWMRIDGKGDAPLAFDNMQNRPIKGTRSFSRHDVVLDVARDASAIAFGILLDGAGGVWMSGLRLEVVDASVPTTDLLGAGQKGDGPKNLDFDR